MKILSFLALPNGWCYGYGVAPFLFVALKAINATALLRSFGMLSTDAFPAEDGSVLVTGYIDDYTVEVYCESDWTVRQLYT